MEMIYLHGFEQLGYDVTFDELENGLVYSAISSTSATATANSNKHLLAIHLPISQLTLLV